MPAAGFIIFLAMISSRLYAQDSSILAVTSTWQAYRQQVKDDPSKEMVELKSRIPGLVYDLRYATANNFMHRLMYPAHTSTAFMRLPAVEALQQVQRELNEQGWGLKVFDAYRPYAVTVKFWELVGDERYVANPAKGSGHNRGIAIDLTLIDLQTGVEADMGTGFDNFSDTARPAFTGLPAAVLQNRKRLQTVMEKHGFRVLATEWWHYYLPEANRFEVLDISFKQLGKRL